MWVLREYQEIDPIILSGIYILWCHSDVIGNDAVGEEDEVTIRDVALMINKAMGMTQDIEASPAQLMNY